LGDRAWHTDRCVDSRGVCVGERWFSGPGGGFSQVKWALFKYLGWSLFVCELVALGRKIYKKNLSMS